MGGQFAADQGVEVMVEVVGFFQFIGKFAQLLCHHCVEDDVGAGNGERRTHHTELELISGESHGRSTVAVRVVHGDGRHGIDADVQIALARVGIGRVIDNGIDDSAQLFAHKDGHNSGRGFLSAKAVVIAGGGDSGAEHILVFVDALDEGSEEEQELGVFAGSGTGLEEILTGIRAQGPVVVLARSVDTGEGLFMEKAHKSVAVGYLFHDLHGDLVLVAGHVGVCVDRRHFVLGGSDLIVLGLGQDTQLPELIVQVLHVGLDAGADRSVVVIFQLLSPGRFCAEESAAGHDQILALLILFLVDEEIFLLGADLGDDALGRGVSEEAQDPDSFFTDRIHGAKQRCLFVKCMTGIGTEDGGNAKRLFLNKSKRCGVPCGVAAGFKGRPEAAGREGRCV